MTRQLRIAVLSGLFMLLFLAMVHSVRAQTKAPENPHPTNTPTPLPVSDRMMNIPYFTLRDGMSSTLTLNNNMSGESTVKVTIFNTHGKGILAPPITLRPKSVAVFKLEDLLGHAGEEFDSGNIEVRYTGPSMGVTCQVGVSSIEKRVSFESRMQDPMGFLSSNLNGIVSLPDQEADGFLALTSVAATKVTVQVAIGSKKNQISLLPRQTELLQLNFDGHRPLAALVQLQHDGHPGDIIATGFVLNLKDGYSSTLTMVDPSSSRSEKLAGAHFRFGKPDKSEGFPDGTEFRSPLFLANVSGKQVNARVSVDYTTQEKTDAAQKEPPNDVARNLLVGNLTLAPGEVQEIELAGKLASLGVSGPVEDAGVDIVQDGAAGAIIGNLTSVDQSGDFAFEVPIKDPFAIDHMASNSYPWSLEDGTNTTLHLKNTTDKKTGAMVEFYFPDGRLYSPDLMVLQPYQTIAIDMQKLKDSKKPDVAKQLFPPDATHGKLVWIEHAVNAIIGRAEQANIKTGIARSFSCAQGCYCPSNIYNLWMAPSSSYTNAVGYSGTPFVPAETLQDCNGMIYPANWQTGGYYPDSTWNAVWSSDYPAVASVNSSSGAVTINSGGVTNVHYNFGIDYYSQFDGICYSDPRSYEASASVTGLAPTSLSIFSNDSTPPEASCGIGCGVTRSFKYQVNDQLGHPLQVGGYNVWDAFATPSPDGLNIGSRFTTTCVPANTGPCGPQTDGNGRFDELGLSVCAGACRPPPNNVCTLGNGAYSQVTQTWHVGPSSINQTIRYYCDHVTVNGS